MGFENVNLWFAKDKNNEIMMIKDIIEENKHNEYTCPICGGLVRANTGTIKSWYFSHINADDCSSETIVHWFVKHELLKVGEKFKVKINDNIEEYVCKEIIEEKEYNTKYGVYKPDLTVVTTTNEIIYIEVANTNNKKIKDFINMWEELGDTVIEFKVGEVLNGNKIEVFNSIWYEGKEYHNQLKELRQICNKEKEKYNFTKEQVKQIDWLINDICKYNNGLIEIDKLSDEIQLIENEEQRQLVCNIVRNKKCGNVLNDYVVYNKNKIINFSSIKKVHMPRKIYDRIYGNYGIVSSNIELDKINILKINDIDKYEIVEKINNIKDIYVERIERILNNNSIEICYKGKTCNIDYEYKNENKSIEQINIFKTKIDNELIKCNILKNNILLNTYNAVKFDKFNIDYWNNKIVCNLYYNHSRDIVLLTDLKKYIEDLNNNILSKRKETISINKTILRYLKSEFSKLNLKDENIKIGYDKNKKLSCFYKNKKIIDNEYINIESEWYNEYLNEIVIKIKKIIELEKVNNKLKDKISLLNKRFEENVYRRPFIKLERLSDCFDDDYDNIVIKVYIKYKNKFGGLSNRKINYFTVIGEESLKELENKTCDIIRNYIYRDKEY